MEQTNKIGVLGSGPVGQQLTKGFIKHGYQVMIGSRTPEKLKEFQQEVDHKAETGTFEQTADFGDMVVLAGAGRVAEQLIESVKSRLDGKVVIDATNPISQDPPENGVIKFFTNGNESLMERLQAIAPAAKFVKSFSCVGNPFMVDPQFPDGKPTMFIGGDDEEAKKAVTGILEEFGWDVADMGKKEAARAIEPLCILWCIPGFLYNQWGHAFRLMKL